MKILAIIMGIMGSVFGIIGLVFGLYSFDYSSNGIEVDGVVVDINYSRSTDSSSYYPIFEYTTTNGEIVKRESSMGSNPSTYDVGDKIKVLYIEDNYKEGKINSFTYMWLFPLIFGGIGSIFLIISIFVTIKIVLRKKQIEKLKLGGQRIRADIIEIKQDRTYKVNGKHPYNIYCKGENPNTYKIMTYKSDYVWEDPQEHLHSKKIDVLIDYNDPKIYWVDISFAEKKRLS